MWSGRAFQVAGPACENARIQSAVIGVQKYEIDDTLKTSGRYAAATTNSRTNTNPNLNTTPLT